MTIHGFSIKESDLLLRNDDFLLKHEDVLYNNSAGIVGGVMGGCL